MREWLAARDGAHAAFEVRFYPARYDVVRGSFFARRHDEVDGRRRRAARPLRAGGARAPRTGTTAAATGGGGSSSSSAWCTRTTSRTPSCTSPRTSSSSARSTRSARARTATARSSSPTACRSLRAPPCATSTAAAPSLSTRGGAAPSRRRRRLGRAPTSSARCCGPRGSATSSSTCPPTRAAALGGARGGRGRTPRRRRRRLRHRRRPRRGGGARGGGVARPALHGLARPRRRVAARVQGVRQPVAHRGAVDDDGGGARDGQIRRAGAPSVERLLLPLRERAHVRDEGRVPPRARDAREHAGAAHRGGEPRALVGGRHRALPRRGGRGASRLATAPTLADEAAHCAHLSLTGWKGYVGDALKKFVFESGPISRQRWLHKERRYRHSADPTEVVAKSLRVCPPAAVSWSERRCAGGWESWTKRIPFSGKKKKAAEEVALRRRRSPIDHFGRCAGGAVTEGAV